jgi:hypothetical protein
MTEVWPPTLWPQRPRFRVGRAMTTTTATELRHHLDSLLAERAFARIEGLADNALYMDHLDKDITASHAAYVGTAVTEIATLRGELGARNQG